MKKILMLICAALLLGMFTLTGIAGDNAHHLMHGNQDALLVGEVLEITDEYILIDVVRTVSGQRARSPFRLLIAEINGHEDSMLQRADFSQGDGIVVSVDFTGNRQTGTRQHGVYNAQLMQDGKVRINSRDSDEPWVEWYVNTGERNLFGMRGMLFRATEETQELLYDGETWHIDSLDPAFRAPSVVAGNFAWLAAGGGLLAILAVAAIAVLLLRKRKTSS